jgi:dTDP-4-dehydrorhamnose reductase
MSRVLVTGASGLVGSRQVVRLRGRHEVHGSYRAHRPAFLAHPEDRLHDVDVRDLKAFRELLDRVDPTVVVHCAAMTNVDACESAPQEAGAANVAPVETLAAWARRRGVQIVQMSTDYVFDGERPPYEIDAVPHPLCVYSRTKAEAEAVAWTVPRSLIARATVIYGADFGHLKRNFAVWLLAELEAGRAVRVVDDQWNTPTIAEQIAEVVERALDRGTAGIIHSTADECVSRFEFARRIAARFGLDASLIHPVRTEELKQPARRPKRACMSVRRTEEILGMKMWSIGQSLDLLHRQLRHTDRSVLTPWWT